MENCLPSIKKRDNWQKMKKKNGTVIQSNDASGAASINEDTELSRVWGCNEWNPLSPKTKRFTLEAHNRCRQFASIFHFSKWILSALPLPWSLNCTRGDGDREPKGKHVSFCLPSVHLYLPFLILTKDGTTTNVTVTGANYPSLY